MADQTKCTWAVTKHIVLEGIKGRSNPAMFHGTPEAESTVIYFPGDIQNIEDDMLDAQWLEYSLEKTQDLLLEKFPSSNILTIRPAEVSGCYSLFLNLTTPGESLPHMIALLNSLNTHIGPEALPSELILVGFSRGVLVINHFFAELATILNNSSVVLDWGAADIHHNPAVPIPPGQPDVLKTYKSKAESMILMQNKDQIIAFFDRIQEVHYLDGHRYPTNLPVCQKLSNHIRSSRMKLCLHLTPRQKFSREEPWGHQELAVFERLLQTQQTKFYSKLYFAGEPLTLQTHFKILKGFVV